MYRGRASTRTTGSAHAWPQTTPSPGEIQRLRSSSCSVTVSGAIGFELATFARDFGPICPFRVTGTRHWNDEAPPPLRQGPPHAKRLLRADRRGDRVRGGRERP